MGGRIEQTLQYSQLCVCVVIGARAHRRIGGCACGLTLGLGSVEKRTCSCGGRASRSTVGSEDEAAQGGGDNLLAHGVILSLLSAPPVFLREVERKIPRSALVHRALPRHVVEDDSDLRRGLLDRWRRSARCVSVPP